MQHFFIRLAGSQVGSYHQLPCRRQPTIRRALLDIQTRPWILHQVVSRHDCSCVPNTRGKSAVRAAVPVPPAKTPTTTYLWAKPVVKHDDPAVARSLHHRLPNARLHHVLNVTPTLALRLMRFMLRLRRVTHLLVWKSSTIPIPIGTPAQRSVGTPAEGNLFQFLTGYTLEDSAQKQVAEPFCWPTIKFL